MLGRILSIRCSIQYPIANGLTNMRRGTPFYCIGCYFLCGGATQSRHVEGQESILERPLD